MRDQESHNVHRVGWLRAAVLGANDGIVSTAALLLGMAAADSSRDTLLTAGMAGLVAGAVSMALGEYVSVASQRDTERSDIRKERWELEHQADSELKELTAIYRHRGLSPELARQVAEELTAHDALGSHLRDELGISAEDLARPVQAAASSAAAFSVGGAVPMIAAAVASGQRIPILLVVTLVALLVLGFLGARAGGARPKRPMLRVVLGGMGAVGVTMAVGWAFGAVVG